MFIVEQSRIGTLINENTLNANCEIICLPLDVPFTIHTMYVKYALSHGKYLLSTVLGSVKLADVAIETVMHILDIKWQA